MDRDSTGGFGIGFLVGAVIGATLGLLFAPQAGKETREQIKERATEVVEKTKGKVAEIRHAVEERLPKRETGE